MRQGFTGHEHDDELGLINMRGRVYNPRLGRFLTPDPLVQAPFSSHALNRYSYVLNNPLNPMDPSGFQTVVIGERWRPEENPASMVEQAEELRCFPTKTYLDTQLSEAPVRVGGPAGPVDQSGSRGSDPRPRGGRTVQACCLWASPHPCPPPPARLRGGSVY